MVFGPQVGRYVFAGFDEAGHLGVERLVALHRVVALAAELKG
jgi:hypothetical protein